MYILSLLQLQRFYEKNFKSPLPELKRDTENILTTNRKGYTITATYIPGTNRWNVTLKY
jgi:hypothetical protein